VLLALSELFVQVTAVIFAILIKVEGQELAATVSLNLPVKNVIETDLLGDGSRPVASAGNQFNCHIRPWKVQTFSIT